MNILFGAGLALGITARIPRGHRLLWADMLAGSSLVCALVAVLLLARSRWGGR
ncbi:hypothetical protein [Streptomyces sp. NPDC047042]|uniref:hypothetical protein n=1 Tax=Streptomyces sp. NPDC047042 TaxID=3154807 RepID=UPI0034103CB4